jgi:hypothetical protein
MPATKRLAGTKNFCPGTRMARSYNFFTQTYQANPLNAALANA